MCITSYSQTVEIFDQIFVVKVFKTRETPKLVKWVNRGCRFGDMLNSCCCACLKIHVATASALPWLLSNFCTVLHNRWGNPERKVVSGNIHSISFIKAMHFGLVLVNSAEVTGDPWYCMVWLYWLSCRANVAKFMSLSCLQHIIGFISQDLLALKKTGRTYC